VFIDPAPLLPPEFVWNGFEAGVGFRKGFAAVLLWLSKGLVAGKGFEELGLTFMKGLVGAGLASVLDVVFDPWFYKVVVVVVTGY
jgi:hypothetical protein